MQYVCDAGEMTWFRFETEGEAALESKAMDHAVEKYFKQYRLEATASYVPPANAPAMEQNIGLKSHIARVMPRFLTLRNKDGSALVTAMLPPEGEDPFSMRPIVVGQANSDPYVDYEDAIVALANHVDMELERNVCFPYGRR